jgi:tRNA pseudouridine13 synthase
VRLKERPEDFLVEEVSRPPPNDTHGEYWIFRVEKRGVAPLEALGAIARALGVDARDVAFAGLKDLRSRATQLLSVRMRGEAREVALPGLRLVPVHRAARPVRGDDIERNRFTLIVRDVSAADAALVPARVEAVRRTGLPNYFDDQRFGGASPERGFVAEAWSKGDLDRALALLVARASPKDPRRERLEKKLVAERLASPDFVKDPAAVWRGLAKEVRGEGAPVVRALARDARDLGAAFRALDLRLRTLLVSQYQSWLWNEAVAAEVRAALPRAETFDVMYRAGTLVFWRAPAGGALEPLRAREVPFADFPLPDAIGVRAKGGGRPLVLAPDPLEAAPDEPDELHPGRRRITLRLELPRSSYATLVAKRVFYEPNIVGRSAYNSSKETGHGGEK